MGVVLYLDHDMDSTVSGAKEAQPLTERNHATTDAVFVGGIVAGSYTAQGLPSEALVPRSGMMAASMLRSQRAGCKSRATSTWKAKSRPSKDIVAEERVSGAHHTHSRRFRRHDRAACIGGGGAWKT